MATDRHQHHHQQLESTVWRACAGSSIQIPAVGSRVYYFPQGHAEQSFTPPSFSPIVSNSLSLCRVLDVRYLANPDTDEVFAKIQLLPLPPNSPDQPVAGHDEGDDNENENDVVSFAKILTPSDANNGGGFSVPRFCADSIFPPLNFQDDPPVQNLHVRDVHGVVWEFRHIYRGTPRRHLLTTGWSKFVNHKKLVAGDSVVFMRSRQSGEIFVGIRRAVRANADCNGRWNYFKEERGVDREVFSRNVRGRITAEAVEEAAGLAAAGARFEVVYYPRAGTGDFVVKAEKVEGAFGMFWTVGMRVKMAMETEDSSRMTWFQGTVSSAAVPDSGPWRGSPWRMLQVTWDEPEILQHMKRVSPWQVEYVVPTSSLHSEFPPTKKCRGVSQASPGFVPDEDELFFPMATLANSMFGQQFNPSSSLNYNTNNNSFLPASIQGARQDQICVSGVSSFVPENTPRPSYYTQNVPPMLETVSTELNIGSLQAMDNLSPDSQGSVHFFGNNEFVRKRACDVSSKVGATSFQLFGKIIQLNKPVEGGFDEGQFGKVNNFTKLFDGIDVQCQRASSAVEACHV